MTYEKRELLGIVREQLAVEYNCLPDDFTKSNNIVTLPSLNEKRRHFSDKPAFFKMATMGGNAVISADERLHAWLEGFIAGKQGHWLFEHTNLREIESHLGKHDEWLWQSHHMFLPEKRTAPPSLDIPVKWFEQDQIHEFYGGGRFPNALCEEFKPERPDVLAVVAYENDKVIGMAGCSADTPLMWQIGIDIDTNYRGQGIGTYLVSLLKEEIMRRGKLPYYGTSLSNLKSWNVALNCGFFPAWVEIVTR